MTVDQRQPAYLQPYARAVQRHGTDFGALLWASPRTQRQRFEAMVQLVDPTGLFVLDLGCGRADLLDFLIQRDIAPARYVGIEGVAELASAAERKNHSSARIVWADFVQEPQQMGVGADVIFCSGALNTIEPDEFCTVVREAFAAAKRALVFNFLCSPMLAAASFLRWHHRDDVIRFARTLTDSVEKLDSYIPGDCTLALRKAQDQQ